jgi:hypothetical protein
VKIFEIKYSIQIIFSIVLLAVADANYKFLYTDIGGYGHQSDANLFSSSKFKEQVENSNLGIPPACNLPNSNIECNYFFVGDNALPLLDYLMKPFTVAETREQRIYNYRYLLI